MNDLERQNVRKLRTRLARVEKGLRDIQDIHDQESCQCTDPPEDRKEDAEDPAAHSQYCPVYLSRYIGNLLAGIHPADPDGTAKAAKEKTGEQ